MEKTKKIVYGFVYIIAVLLTLSGTLSLFRNADNRFIKMLDFPRIQFFMASLVLLIVLIIFIKRWKFYDYVIIVGLSGALIINSVFLIQYTPLVNVEVPTAKKTNVSDQHLSLLLANVKMSNRNEEPLINLIQVKKPDLILVMEIDDWWDEQLKVMKKDYPYSQHTINDVTYGMVLYSKFPIQSIDVDYRQNDNVPSFESTIILPNGNTITLHCVHPVPPTHFKELPDNKGQEEDGLRALGNEIRGHNFPTIVAGDMNDVVWSYVDKLTGTTDILYDVRVGRGFYNSYNAHNFLMRWPLDHVFVTKEFQLKKMERLPKIGSDHFPIFVELVLEN